MELCPDHFDIFFRAIHGHNPFPWQTALVDRLAEFDEWPDVLELPTGAGKTAAIDAAVFHAALRSGTPGKAALRIAFVVDRRLVVDDAFSRANKIATVLRRAHCSGIEANEVSKEIARRLSQVAGDGMQPLVVRRLRGGAPMEHDWARTPTQPTILCSTVDQIGSRLLFRGYGVSDRMKPVHAGLLGTDSLILLDEAHLSEPFRQTLTAVRNIGGANVRTALLSATPGVKAKRPLVLSLADRDHPILKTRLETSKPAELKKVSGGPDDIAKAFAKTARAMASRLMDRGVLSPAVGVVVNRVNLARGIFDHLNGDGGFNTILMIGRSRESDRNRIVKKLDPFRTNSSGRLQASPTYIVATQCLEVGVDLDLDGLVTQAASLDALRQRFGRLNRAGRPIRSEGAVLAHAEDIAKKSDDPVYGDRIRLTWEALQQIAKVGPVDFGAEALPKMLQDAGIDQNGLAAIPSYAPVVMPAYLDIWSQTSPRPATDPEVGLFLHGIARTAAGVSIVWRGDITSDDMEETGQNGKNQRQIDLKELLRLVPPRASEAIEVPLWAARKWLKNAPLDSGSIDAMSDAPERELEADTPMTATNPKKGRLAFRWAGPDDLNTGIVQSEELKIGDMLIVPAEYGGCDQFGWAPDFENTVEDVADDASKPYWGRRCAVRITRDVVHTEAEWQQLSAAISNESIDASDVAERLLDALPSTWATESGEERSATPSPRDVRQPLEAMRNSKGRIKVYFPYSGRSGAGAVIVAERGVKIQGSNALDSADAVTEGDSFSSNYKVPISLQDHTQRVEKYTNRFVQSLGFGDFGKDIILAAKLHDIGKADRRFQHMLSGGNPWNRPDGPSLAKGVLPWSPNAWTRSKLPKGWRHEALSVKMAITHPEVLDANDPELVLWLIGSHHGFGRPFFSFSDQISEQDPMPFQDEVNWKFAADKPGPQSLSFEFRGADWPSLFEILKRRYGIWKLAYLEAILRLADHRASEEENAA